MTQLLNSPGIAVPFVPGQGGAGAVVPGVTAQVKMGRHFARPDDFTQDEATAKRTCAIESAGGKFLEVPGLLSVEAVRAGITLVPLSEVRFYPLGPNGPYESVNEQLISLEKLSDGSQVLMRSELSNDGNWPVGKVYITGEWEWEVESHIANSDAAAGDAHSPVTGGARSRGNRNGG